MRSPAKNAGMAPGTSTSRSTGRGGAHAAHELDEVGIGAGEAADRGDRDGEEADERDHDHLRGGAEAEPQHEQRRQHDHGDRLAGHQERLQHAAGQRHPGEDRREGGARDRSDRQPDERLHAVAEMCRRAAAAARRRRRRRGRGREHVRRAVPHRHPQLPAHDQRGAATAAAAPTRRGNARRGGRRP